MAILRISDNIVAPGATPKIQDGGYWKKFFLAFFAWLEPFNVCGLTKVVIIVKVLYLFSLIWWFIGGKPILGCKNGPKWRKSGWKSRVGQIYAPTVQSYEKNLWMGHTLLPGAYLEFSIQEVRKKSLEPFLRKSTKTSKKGPKSPKMAIFGVSRDHFSKKRIFPDMWLPSRRGQSKVTPHIWGLGKVIDKLKHPQEIPDLPPEIERCSHSSSFQSYDWKS